MPCTADMAKQSQVPLAAVIKPLATLPADEVSEAALKHHLSRGGFGGLCSSDFMCHRWKMTVVGNRSLTGDRGQV